jgi:hypothetical protein
MARKTSYKKEYCDLLLDKMKKGESVIKFCAEAGICRDTFFEWTVKYKSFGAAYKKGKDLCESYWEDIAQKAMLGKAVSKGKGRFNTALFCFYMKNRFSWREAAEEKAPASVPVKPQSNIDVKNLIILNANQSAEAKDRIIQALESIEHEDK